jgi:hypothetical protein
MSDPIRDLLFDTAQEMIAEKREKRKIKSGAGTGTITTAGETACIAGFVGTVFSAELETPQGALEVQFIVRPTRKLRATDIHWQSVSC